MTFTRDVLYSLKQMSVALPIDVYIVQWDLTQVQSGQFYENLIKVAIKKSLVLPGHVSQYYKQFTSSLFRTGGEQQIESKVFIIDQHDMLGYTLKKTDYIVRDGKKYEVLDIEFSEQGESMMVFTKHLIGSICHKIGDLKIRSRANATSTFTVVP